MVNKNICKTDGCTRVVHAAGMCRVCRNKHLEATMRPIGDAKIRVIDLVAHYGTVSAVAKRVGVAGNTIARVYRGEIASRITNTAYNAIMTHQKVGDPVPVHHKPNSDRASWADAAEYALTPEGREFVDHCMAPPKCRGKVPA
ncbi:MAG: hypothetical protein ACTIIH_01675 [Brevibacterium sp.]|uniref:hypothetical protein n=1 Tax=Brevibacterium sp. TaxID=1701 RepID=UPI003F93C259